MSMLVTDDAELYYELHGEGPPLVFIHGASGTHLSWWQQVAELRYHYSCLIYDLRGYGRSRASGEYDPGDGMAHQFADAQLALRLAGRARAFALGFFAS